MPVDIDALKLATRLPAARQVQGAAILLLWLCVLTLEHATVGVHLLQDR